MICWIIEDDYKSEFRQPGGALPRLQGLDGLGRSSDPPPLCTNPLRCTLYGYPFRQRSSFHTMSASPLRANSSASCKAGRSLTAPDTIIKAFERMAGVKLEPSGRSRYLVCLSRHSPDGHRLRKFAPDSMLEQRGFELVVPL